MNVPLETLETLMKYIGSLHSYLCHCFVLFEPKTMDEASVKVVHLKSRGNHEQYDHPEMAVVAKRNESKPSCTHFYKEGHDEEHWWKLHLELRPNRNYGKEK